MMMRRMRKMGAHGKAGMARRKSLNHRRRLVLVHRAMAVGGANLLEHVRRHHVDHFRVDSDHLLIGRKRRPAEQFDQFRVSRVLVRQQTFVVLKLRLVPVSHNCFIYRKNCNYRLFEINQNLVENFGRKLGRKFGRK